MRTVLAYLELMRISNLLTVVTNVLAGFAFALALTDTRPTLEILLRTSTFTNSGPHFLTAVLSVSALYLAGMVLNGIMDESVDARERPMRPLPSGRVSRMGAQILFTILATIGLWVPAGGPAPIPGLLAVIAGVVLLNSRFMYAAPVFRWLARGWTLVGVAAIALSLINQLMWAYSAQGASGSPTFFFRPNWMQEVSVAIFICMVLYNWLHLTTPWSVGLLASCRAFAFLMGAVALGGAIAMSYRRFPGEQTLIVALPALAIFVYTLVLSILARDEAVARHDEPLKCCPRCNHLLSDALVEVVDVHPAPPQLCPECATDLRAHPPVGRRNLSMPPRFAFKVLVPGMFVCVMLAAAGMQFPAQAPAHPDSRALWVVTAMALGIGFVFLLNSSTTRAERLVRTHPTRAATGVGLFIAGFPLFDGLLCVAAGALEFSLVCFAAWQVTRWGQRRIAGS